MPVSAGLNIAVSCAQQPREPARYCSPDGYPLPRAISSAGLHVISITLVPFPIDPTRIWWDLLVQTAVYILGILPVLDIPITSDFGDDTGRTDDFKQAVGLGTHGKLDSGEHGR